MPAALPATQYAAAPPHIQSLLPRLLKEGLTPGSAHGQSRPGELVQVLLEHCILKPLSSGTPVDPQQSSYTLAIIDRQTASNPSYLLDIFADAPFYQWLLPRLIYIASISRLPLLADEASAAVVSVIRGIARDSSEASDPSVLGGPARAAKILDSIILFCQDILDYRDAKLFHCQCLPSNCASLLCSLSIVVQLDLTFSSAFQSTACNMLSQAIPLIQTDDLQTRFIRAVTSAISSGRFEGVTKACASLAGVTFSNDLEGQIALKDFYKNISLAHEEIRVEVWWCLYQRVHTLDMTDDCVGYPAINHLLTSIPPRLPHSSIQEALESEGIIKIWLAKAREIADSTGGPSKERRIQAFRRHETHETDLPSLPSKKRKRNNGEATVRQDLEKLYPDTAGAEDLVDILLRQEESLAPLAPMMPRIVCEIAGEHRHTPSVSPRQLKPNVLDLWLKVAVTDLSMMNALAAIFMHTPAKVVATSMHIAERAAIMDAISSGLLDSDRGMRVATSRALVSLFIAQDSHPDPRVAKRNQHGYIDALVPVLKPLATGEVATLALGEIGRYAEGDALCSVLRLLLEQLGSSHEHLRSVAYAALVNLAKARKKTPYALLNPFLDRISVVLAESIQRSPEMVAETTSFLKSSRQILFSASLQHVVPALVLSRNLDALSTVAGIVKQNIGVAIMDNMAHVLAHIFVHPSKINTTLDFLVKTMRSITDSSISVQSMMRSCTVDFCVILVIQLGDEDPNVRDAAQKGLKKAKEYSEEKKTSNQDVGAFLKPHMAGIISQLNDMLHGALGKKTASEKCKMIRSLGELIKMAGDSMTSFSPQIMASLQSTLGVKELRLETLNTWLTFVDTLRFRNVGPFVGRTTGALVTNWPSFDSEAKQVAKRIVDLIASNAKELKEFTDEVVGMDHIPELRHAAATLAGPGKKAPVSVRISKVLDRAASNNVAISTASMNELKRLLLQHQNDVLKLAQGDTFDAIAAKIMSVLFTVATRDGDYDELRDLSYDCMGILGALDPDRLGYQSESGTVLLMSNFNDSQESINFALHLVRDLLVDAFRATNDTTHQTYLAFAIQELLRFCGFTIKVVAQDSRGVDPQILSRWASFPKDQLETLTPLLETRFSLRDSTARTFVYPIYASTNTYREWLQGWTTDLINKVMSMPGQGRAEADSKSIFGVFKGIILKHQDVTVAHHMLPHLVLNVLLSNNQLYNDEISLEINTVLQDQVQPSGPTGRRSLAAQVIFDLMDHLSKWLRLTRVKPDKSERSVKGKPVEQVLNSIETELMAHAAMNSKAYARSLRSFEERVVQLTREGRARDDLQQYYENLHHIYAELDEPDGMEGVSTFVISPTLEHQIREHESTGRWTAAQSCWEVRLQQSPDDVTLHHGLLKCLRNLGHYDTLRTHIRGVLSRHPEWRAPLVQLEAEAAWIIGDWDTVRLVGKDCPPIGKALLALHENQDLKIVLKQVRSEVGIGITGKGYNSAQDALLQLHMIHEISMINETKTRIETTPRNANRQAIIQAGVRSLNKALEDRFHTTSPAFRTREAILSVRRTAYGLMNTPSLNPEIGDAWILSSKIARKAGYEQTAYSATLQAVSASAPFVFVQQAKLRRAQGSVLKALTDLENALASEKRKLSGKGTNDDDMNQQIKMAKAVLLMARWANETDRFELNEIITRYKEAINFCDNLESPYYHFGHFYDSLTGETKEKWVDRRDAMEMLTSHSTVFKYHTVLMYSKALRYGVKYIFQTMPRMLTIWLDLGETTDTRKDKYVKSIHDTIHKAARELPPYQFFMAFPQIVSRIMHPDPNVFKELREIMVRVLCQYPQQALWPMVGVMQSNQIERKNMCRKVLDKAIPIAKAVQDADAFCSTLLRLADHPPDDKKYKSLKNDFPYVLRVLPSTMILPLQDALTCPLPTSSDTVQTHTPFPSEPIEIKNIADRVEMMSSLVKPKKLMFIGSDGKEYPFLCKPHDDLRKDARLMDLNSMINKLLKRASESRKRQLYVRTYAVMPLNEECGLLEWVANTAPFKSILEKCYARYGKRVWVSDVGLMQTKLIHHLRSSTVIIKRPWAMHASKIWTRYQPTRFNEWFLTTWPEPSAWMASRSAYSRTLAVMSMIGYVLGLGDRHGENILFDGLTGDTVHVDLNCLFEKGTTFEIPERVPFRLTQNLVGALGVTGVEGVYRKAAEITLDILRSNSDSLMSVLEAFVHDPLVEWARSGRGKKSAEKDVRDIRHSADRNLRPIKRKLRGIMKEKDDKNTVLSVPSQVDYLIKEATSPNNLGLMYLGWAPWL
ncbi:hypothetical protein I350_04149 [Cryptococcus amylolentus CBS 6273]|uniref:Serine/threonine-protein kinase MEC1 n=1 Tax=Cryptococcus amylolentus CBS 6273 TaxID=1296118 RepID=A0A1E3K102_9TREE|nr:hypothetical protein I350_04149 [Cryptococcus amylolentus CBS 6273]